ncbi:hypothetical protein F5Y15DRAFT_426590 [Xylariaceae sp. FL0016]|nr:hypothetical protein F5Y15DRAFT_426590 [Xylariaceae sp. FL0016]
MAIICSVPGVEVTIRIAGKTAIEYGDPADTGTYGGLPHSSSKFIECLDGQQFTVHLRVTKDYEWGYKNHSLNFALLIDGQWVKGELCRAHYTRFESWDRDITNRVVPKGDTVSATGFISQTFKFSTVSHIDDDDHERIASDTEKAKKFGSIEIKVYRTIESESESVFMPPSERPKAFQLAEQSLKGKSLSHATNFSASHPVTQPSYVQCSNLQEDNGPLAMYRFQYRSRESLMQEGVLSRPHTFVPVPGPLAQLRQEAINDLALDSLRRRDQQELQECRIRERREQSGVNIKNEPGGRDAPPPPNVMEVSSRRQDRRQNYTVPQPELVINLDSDNEECSPVRNLRSVRRDRGQTITIDDDDDEADRATGNGIAQPQVKAKAESDSLIRDGSRQNSTIQDDDSDEDTRLQVKKEGHALIRDGAGQTFTIEDASIGELRTRVKKDASLIRDGGGQTFTIEDDTVEEPQPCIKREKHSLIQRSAGKTFIIDDDEAIDEPPHQVKKETSLIRNSAGRTFTIEDNAIEQPQPCAKREYCSLIGDAAGQTFTIEDDTSSDTDRPKKVGKKTRARVKSESGPIIQNGLGKIFSVDDDDMVEKPRPRNEQEHRPVIMNSAREIFTIDSDTGIPTKITQVNKQPQLPMKERQEPTILNLAGQTITIDDEGRIRNEKQRQVQIEKERPLIQRGIGQTISQDVEAPRRDPAQTKKESDRLILKHFGEVVDLDTGTGKSKMFVKREQADSLIQKCAGQTLIIDEDDLDTGSDCNKTVFDGEESVQDWGVLDHRDISSSLNWDVSDHGEEESARSEHAPVLRQAQPIPEESKPYGNEDKKYPVHDGYRALHDDDDLSRTEHRFILSPEYSSAGENESDHSKSHAIRDWITSTLDRDEAARIENQVVPDSGQSLLDEEISDGNGRKVHSAHEQHAVSGKHRTNNVKDKFVGSKDSPTASRPQSDNDDKGRSPPKQKADLFWDGSLPSDSSDEKLFCSTNSSRQPSPEHDTGHASAPQHPLHNPITSDPTTSYLDSRSDASEDWAPASARQCQAEARAALELLGDFVPAPPANEEEGGPIHHNDDDPAAVASRVLDSSTSSTIFGSARARSALQPLTTHLAGALCAVRRRVRRETTGTKRPVADVPPADHRSLKKIKTEETE